MRVSKGTNDRDVVQLLLFLCFFIVWLARTTLCDGAAQHPSRNGDAEQRELRTGNTLVAAMRLSHS